MRFGDEVSREEHVFVASGLIAARSLCNTCISV